MSGDTYVGLFVTVCYDRYEFGGRKKQVLFLPLLHMWGRWLVPWHFYQLQRNLRIQYCLLRYENYISGWLCSYLLSLNMS